MIGITPVDIFPLNYPKGDTAIPEKGAKAVPFILDWSKDNTYTANLLQVRDQKFFGSLRCIWIDAIQCLQNFTVAVNGTEQIFTVIAGTSAYYPVINLNVPVITFLMASKESTLARVICLNFVPSITTPPQIAFPSSIVVSGNVAVTNFPATQPISGSVSVSNFPATQSVAVNNFPSIVSVQGVSTGGVSGVSISSTSPVTFSAASATFIRYLSVAIIGATVPSAGNVSVEIIDGSGTLRVFITVFVPAAAQQPYLLMSAPDLNTPLVNGANVSTIKLSTNLTAGSIFVGFSLT